MAVLALPPWLLLIGAVIGYVLYSLHARFQNRSKLPLPPKAPGLPIVGSMLDILSATKVGQQHLLFQKWAREYGEIVRVEAGPFTQYFINSDAAVKEIIDRQSSATSERPRWIVSNEQICNEKNVLLLSASHPIWKLQRKVILHGMTSVPRADAGLPYLHYETAKFLIDVASNEQLAASSVSLFNEIGRYTYSAFASQTFGMNIPNADNPAIDYIFRSGLEQILGTLPGSYLVDILPILDHLPTFMKPWETRARALFQNNLAWCTERMHRLQASLRAGTVSDSFLSRVLQDEKNMGFSDPTDAAYLAFMLIIGAADTSKMSTWSFLEAMMRFPDVQKKSLAQIEAVVRCCGPTTRLRSGHPHMTTKELTYGEHRIPAGSRIHLNSWAIGHDPKRHHDPERFWPERYEGDLTTSEESKNMSDVGKRDHFAFGSGRRVCPGYHVAERSLAIAIMRLVWAFEIVPAGTAKMPLDPWDYPGEMPGNPGEHMPVVLKIRNEAKKSVIEKEFEREKATYPAMEPIQ